MADSDLKDATDALPLPHLVYEFTSKLNALCSEYGLLVSDQDGALGVYCQQASGYVCLSRSQRPYFELIIVPLIHDEV